MKYRLATNVAATSLFDAARLALPVWRALFPARLRRLAAADSHHARDMLLQRWSRQLLDALAVDVDITGLDAVSGGPYLVAPLHESFVDAPVLLEHLALPLTFVARAELAAEKPIGRLLRASRQILIEPEAPGTMQAVLRETSLLVAQGRSVAIFPQGTLLGVETAFQSGAWIVAGRLDLPVLPVAIWGTHAVWDHPFSPALSRGKSVRVRVFPPRRINSAAEFRALESEMKDLALADDEVAPRRYEPDRDGYWDGYRFEIDPRFEELAAQVAEHRQRAESLQRR